MMGIFLKLDKINENIDRVAADVKELVIVTKCLNLTNELIEGLNLGNHYIYDTRLDNLKLLRKSNKKLLFHYPHYKIVGDETSRVIVSDKNELEGATKDNVKTIYLNFDFGDKRDGFYPHQKEEILNYLRSLNLKNRKLVLMGNIGCFESKKPNKKYFDDLYELNEYFTKKDVNISYPSIGGSNCLPFLKDQDKRRIFKNAELRIREALFTGTIPHSDIEYGLNREIAFLKTNVSNRDGSFLAGFGYNHLDQSCILSKSGIRIQFQSSDMSSLRLNNKTKDELLKNSQILIPISYKGLSRLSYIKDIKYNFV